MKTRFFFAHLITLITLLVFSCSDSTTEISKNELCQNVICSDHGSCSLNNGNPTCICDEGYSAEGLNCIENTIDPCEGITCSDHGSCTSVNGNPTCTCDEGYSAEGLNCIENTIDPCEGITCSDHGSCTLVNGNPTCTCDEGYSVEGLNCIEEIERETLKILSSDSDDIGLKIAEGDSHHIYIAGRTEGTFDENLNHGKTDIFLAKYDTLNNLIWLKQYGSPEEDYILNLKTYHENIYLYGSTEGSINGETCQTSTCSFIIKLDNTGEILWTKLTSRGGIRDLQIKNNELSILLYQHNDLYIEKYSLEGTQILTPILLTSGAKHYSSFEINSNNHIYLLYIDTSNFLILDKYSFDGTRIWRKNWTPAVIDKNVKIKIGSDNNLYIMASTRLQFSFNGINIPDNSYLKFKTILMKLEETGEEYWTRLYMSSEYDIWNNDFSLDSEANIYLTGSFNYNGFLIKYNSNGEIQYINNSFELNNAEFSSFWGIYINRSNHIYLTGKLHHHNNTDAFMLRYIEE